MSEGVERIAEERQRQITEEGWTLEHDAVHYQGALARAGVAYAMLGSGYCSDENAIYKVWPFEERWWKPSDDPVRNLVKAGALIAAEIDRILALDSQRASVG